MEIRFVDWFASIGGFRHGLEKANREKKLVHTRSDIEGQEATIHGTPPKTEGGNDSSIGGNNQIFCCVGACEIDRYCRTIYERKFGHKPEWEDSRAVNPAGLPDFDLFCAGFPCQSFSIAGSRGGFSDIRGTLFFEICRIIGAKRTPYILLENVKGLLSAPYTESIEEWQEEDFDSETGEPTTRAGRRHKVVSGTKGWVFLTILNSFRELGYDCQWEVLNSKNFGVPQNRERVFIIGCLRGKPRLQVFPLGEAGELGGPSTWAYAIDSHIGKGIRGHRRRSLIYEGAIMSEQNQKWLENGKKLSRNFPQGQRVYSSEGIASAICGDAGGLGHKTGLYRVPLKYLNRNQRNIEGDYAFTIDGANTGGILEGSKIRRLTPLECERLQGFPDGWTEGVSDTQRYKMLGNAVTTTVITAIGERLLGEILTLYDGK